MKRLIAVLTAVAVVAGLMAIPALAATKTVRLRDNVFAPRSITIKRNDSIRFVWAGKNPHNVLTRSRPRGAARVSIGTRTRGSARKRSRTRGTYRLHCSIHQGMNLTVRVR